MDNGGYPTKAELKELRTWPIKDFVAFAARIKELWYYPEAVEYRREGDEHIVELSTGGWSGNEDLIGALMDNHLWWTIFWYQSTRGGRYVFKSSYKEDTHEKLKRG